MVARQFIAWVAQRQNPSRRERCDKSPPELTICRRDHSSDRNQDACEYGTSNHSSYRALRDRFQAINCLATIIESLRDDVLGYAHSVPGQLH